MVLVISANVDWSKTLEKLERMTHHTAIQEAEKGAK